MRPNRSNMVNRNRQAAAGVQKHFATNATPPTVIIDGVPYPPANIVSALQAPIDAADATAAAAAAFHNAVAAEKASTAAGNAMYLGLKRLVTSQFKNVPGTLAEFGITLPTPQVPTVATKAAAAQKRVATRTARHTMGKRQKAKVTGQTPPVNEPVATAPSPATPSNVPPT